MKITIEKEPDGEYRVPSEDGYEDGASYTDYKEDAIAIAKRVFGKDVEIKFRSVPEFTGAKYAKMKPKNESLDEANTNGLVKAYDEGKSYSKKWNKEDKVVNPYKGETYLQRAWKNGFDDGVSGVKTKNPYINESSEDKPMYGYIAFYGNKKIEVHSNKGKLDAQNKAQEEFQKMFPRKKVKGYDIALEIAEKDGKQQTIRTESNVHKILLKLTEKLTKDSDGNLRDEFNNTYSQHPGNLEWNYAVIETGDWPEVRERKGLKNKGILAVFRDRSDATAALNHMIQKR